MTRRNLGTTAILAVAGVLLIGGMAFAREAERDDEGGAPPGATQTDAPTNPSQSASAAPSFDDNGGDDNGGHGGDDNS
ncbi:MAG: hypothetical protein ACXWWL_01100 [Candidatus Limnocylindria bacterium]